MISKNTICLWYDGTALDAATFYAETFRIAPWGPSIAHRETIPRGSRAMS
jgi:predicted 3-demethylubiquinone-9 3-methyltransferase (glyoxalase superfamily)